MNVCARGCAKMEHDSRITLEMKNQAIYFDEGEINETKKENKMIIKVLRFHPKLIGLMHETKISLGAYI